MKKRLQLLILEQLSTPGKYSLYSKDGRICLAGPKLPELQFDPSDSYLKVAISLPRRFRGDYPNRKPLVYLHYLVLLNENLKRLEPGQSLEAATLPEDFEIDHENGKKRDNGANNLKAKSRSENQSNKPKRPPLTDFQLHAIGQIFAAFPDLNVRAFSHFIDRSRGEVERIKRAANVGKSVEYASELPPKESP